LDAVFVPPSTSMVGTRSQCASSLPPPMVSMHYLNAIWMSLGAGFCTMQVILWSQNLIKHWSWSSPWRRSTARTRKVVCALTRCSCTPRAFGQRR
jgi:hypothetical protein